MCKALNPFPIGFDYSPHLCYNKGDLCRIGQYPSFISRDSSFSTQSDTCKIV